jgi:hypothetical protein
MVNKKINNINVGLGYGRQFIDSLNNSKLLAGLTMLLLNIGSKYIEIGFSKTQEQALRNGLARELLIFAVVFMATHDIIMSILLTAAFVVLSDFLLNEKSQFCIVPEKLRAISVEVDTDKDGHISDEEERAALDILRKAELQKTKNLQNKYKSYFVANKM